jgi:hypothetical protein
MDHESRGELHGGNVISESGASTAQAMIGVVASGSPHGACRINRGGTGLKVGVGYRAVDGDDRHEPSPTQHGTRRTVRDSADGVDSAG